MQEWLILDASRQMQVPEPISKELASYILKRRLQSDLLGQWRPMYWNCSLTGRRSNASDISFGAYGSDRGTTGLSAKEKKGLSASIRVPFRMSFAANIPSPMPGDGLIMYRADTSTLRRAIGVKFWSALILLDLIAVYCPP